MDGRSCALFGGKVLGVFGMCGIYRDSNCLDKSHRIVIIDLCENMYMIFSVEIYVV